MNRYPDEHKAATLMRALDDASRSWDSTCVTREVYERVSAAIHRLVELAGSDPYLIRDWVWVTAQLRIAHPDDQPAARTAWGGVTLFLTVLSNGKAGDPELLPTLRWLTDRVVEELIAEKGPHSIDRLVSPAEKKRIDDLILDLAEASEPDLQTLVGAADQVAKGFSSIHHSAYFPSVADKLRRLAKIAEEATEAGYWARAALRYVYLERDVIDDTLGYIGYLDDIQVIEEIYGFTHGELPWRQLIAHAVEQWPMLSRIYWTDGNTTNHLTPFLKSTAACALDAALDEENERVIVTPEVGPLGFVSAALCALADLKTEPRGQLPAPGSLVTFRHDHFARFAVVEKPYDAGGGVALPMIRLRDGSTSIPAGHAALLEPATVDDPQLATLRQVEQWMKTVKADQLTPIWRYRRPGVRPSVLYVTDRSKFFERMNQIRPFGRRLDELLPVSYHTRGGRTTIGAGATTATPAMIVCNDLATAETSLKTTADEECPPRYVIIDRTVDPDSLRSLTHRCRQLDADVRIITFAPPESVRHVAPVEQRTSTWLIRPDEVDPIPGESAPHGVRSPGTGPLATFNRRQVTATDVDFRTVPVQFNELDRFATLADNIATRVRREPESGFEAVAIAAELALRQISGHPPLGKQLLDARIEGTLVKIQSLAALHRLFDAEVAQLEEAATALTEKLRGVHPKDAKLRALLEQHPDARVLVTSRALAEEMNAGEWLCTGGRASFIAPHDLDGVDRISVLIVPCWFGTQDMRRLQYGGWAPLQLRVLFSYETARLKRLNGRLAREFGSLARRTRRSWRSFAARNPEVGTPPPALGQGEADRTLAGGDSSQAPGATNVNDGVDWLETTIRNRVAASSQSDAVKSSVTARLIFFDDGQHYGVFANETSLVCLNEVLGGSSDLAEIGETEAEKLLWKKVNCLSPGDILAFPDDPAFADVIDGLADALIGDQGETRRSAGLWRVAVRTIVEQCGWDMERARQRLAEVGVKREVSTLASWLYSTKTVAPKRHADTIPALLKCAARDPLVRRTEEILAAASTVYAARRKAARVLVAQLSSAAINAASGAAYVHVGGTDVRYRLLTVATVDGAAPFAPGVIGLHTTEDELPKAVA